MLWLTRSSTPGRVDDTYDEHDKIAYQIRLTKDCDDKEGSYFENFRLLLDWF